MSVLRNVCFTINNYDVEDISRLADLVETNCKYMIIGFEVGESGTPHIQGYVEFARQISFNVIKKKWLPVGHFEARRGTSKQAADYCKKEGNWLHFGELSRPGKRTDLDGVRETAQTEGMRAVTRTANFQEIRVAEKYLTYNEEARKWKPTVIWIWGPTGTGKSSTATELCKDGDTYRKNTATKWWDGYDGHENIIIDDFRPSWWDLTYMLGLLDRYEFQVEVKGGMRQIRARQIIITSAIAPEQCYLGTGEAVEQLLRRIDIIEYMG